MTDTARIENQPEGADETAMPLLEHIIELRNRLMYSVAAIFVAFLVCYYFSDVIYGFLVRPLADAMGEGENRRLIYTALHEAFFTYIKVAFWAAVFVSFPIIASQFWMFIAPGLYKHEKRAFLPFLVATPILFFAGGALLYYLVIPLAWQFFLGFETPGTEGGLPIQLEAKVNEYLSLVMRLIFAFGLSFQLPIALTLMARVGIVDSATLAAKRKYAVVITFICAAVITPPDIISQVGLALPILVLYEISIWMAKVAEKKRAAAEEAELDED